MPGLDELNTEQQHAATAKCGPLVIVAGPGTGKTKTLTARIVYLTTQAGVAPENILALTFTKKAAEEMRSRVSLALRSEGKLQRGGNIKRALPTIATFHALCHDLLGRDMQFISEPERLQIIKKLSRPATYKHLSARELGLLISRAKNGAENDPVLHKLVKAYDAALVELGRIDFDDLLVQTRDMLQTDQAARQAAQARYQTILVDEFQDTNRLQYQLLHLLRGSDDVFVIGDPLQSIYGFRGASGDIFAQFRQDFPHALEVTLHVNYRSAPHIVQVSNRLFSDAPQLTPHHTTPGIARVVQVYNEHSEAAWVLAEIQKAIGGGDMLHAVSDDNRATQRTLKDFAILYRNRSAAKTLQQAVQDSGLPYQIVGDGSPYDQPRIQAIITLMLACQQGEQPPHEGFREAEWRAILNLIQQNEQVSPRALAEHIAQVLGLEQGSALQQFLGGLVRFADLSAALNYFDELAGQQFYDPQADAITLLTIHASKGLEFPHVFLIGVEEGILPHHTANIDEEKRLLYVATTRAQHRLDITHTTHRGGQPARLSSFLQTLDDASLPKETDPSLLSDQRRAVKRAAKRSQQTLF